jgi:hypothetical protein
MSPREPLPLLDDDDADPMLRRLLGSARTDAPSDLALRAAPAAIATLLVANSGLAAGGAATGALAFAKAGSTTVVGVTQLVKWFGIGALLGTASVATITATTSKPERTAPSAAASAPAPAKLESARVAWRANPPALPPASAAPLTSAQASVMARRNDLALEVRLLDEARAALIAGDTERTLERLARADSLRGRVLVPESTVLRVRALIAAGRVSEARRVSAEFLRRAPNAPQANVLRDLVGEIETP